MRVLFLFLTRWRQWHIIISKIWQFDTESTNCTATIKPGKEEWPMSYRILIAEDEPKLLEVLCDFFESKGVTPVPAADGAKALELAENDHFDGVLLDIMMPRLNGLSVCRELRKSSDVPIIFLTAKNLKDDILEGFKLGADDYLTKPFSMDELVYRMEAILRRVKGKGQTKVSRYILGKIVFDTQRQSLIIGDKQTKLTTKESELLSLLCANVNQVLHRDVALKAIWTVDNYFNARSMDVYISKLRKFFKLDPRVEINNVHGRGYRLVAPGE